MTGEPPSTSVAVAEQLRVEVTLMPLVGLIAALEMTGTVLSTLTLALAESVAPEPSVTVAVQAIVSDGDAVELVRVRLELVPRVLVPLVHSYVIVGVSPSASVAVAKQLKVELVVTPELGDTVGPEITGAVFKIVTLSLPVGPSPPSASVGVTTTSHDSPAVVALDGSVALVWLLAKTPPLYQA